MSHKKIMEKASKALKRDAMNYKKEEKQDKSKSAKMKHKVEEKEAMAASKDLKGKARRAHE